MPLKTSKNRTFLNVFEVYRNEPYLNGLKKLLISIAVMERIAMFFIQVLLIDDTGFSFLLLSQFLFHAV